MNGGWRRLKIALDVSFRWRLTVDLGVIVDEGQVLTLFFRIGWFLRHELIYALNRQDDTGRSIQTRSAGAQPASISWVRIACNPGSNSSFGSTRKPSRA